MPIILNDFSRVAHDNPDRIAIIHCFGRGRKNTITYAELEHRSDEFAADLSARGIDRGDFVGVYMNRSIDHVLAILGILKTGAAFYSLNSRSSIEQVTSTASLSRAPVIIVDQDVLINLQNICKDEETSFNLIVFNSEPSTPFHNQIISKISESFPLSRFSPVNPTDRHTPVRQDTVPSDVALALFTSGSTGKPKGVLISHQDLYNRAHTECGYYGITSKDILLNLLPFSFDVGANQLFTALATGAQLIILNSWMPADIASTIKRHHVTGLSAVPAIWAPVLNLPDTDETIEAINSIRYITISGGDLAPDQLKRLGSLLQGTQIFKTYGQAETFRSGILLPSEYRKKMLSVGRPVKGTNVLILNRKGARAAPDEEGEILHFGDGMMLGYLGDAKGTSRKIRYNPLQNKRSLFRQKGVFTGDIGKIDKDGYLYVLGRKDKMIKSLGYRVYPKEICDQILRHAAVQEAVVFGIPDRDKGRAIYAEVQRNPDKELTESELKIFLSDKLPIYMVPSRILFVDSFPRTPSGKVRLAEIERKYYE